ncbi:MAG: Cyclic nucleotide-gated potassium channel [Candidatus Brocadia fulgida]|uniref:Cyclic nucleotide-gated potassium channel n=1 Tax=Candidatus Brocadia fulgida TaxID=380242 RepID=A0A0M2UUB5_9BACT|nr:MAG: Cyclic nucleotide-gated potassium channel [Candidatus Brocadia fulgida]
MFLPLDLRFIRALRLFRLFRILKMGRYSESIRTLGNVLKEEKEALAITVFAVLILLVVASSLMYFVENAAQPEAFSSIPEAMWWGVATLTTVGYGDICPITPLGRFLGAIIALLGIGTIAVPAGIVTSGFAGRFKKSMGKEACAHIVEKKWLNRRKGHQPANNYCKFHINFNENAGYECLMCSVSFLNPSYIMNSERRKYHVRNIRNT